MTIMVKDLPDEERPREKLLTFGAQYLSNTELLAILLHSGTRRKSVLEVAQEILSTYKSDGLASIVNVPPSELTRINGLGPAKAATLLAAVELGLRIAKKPANNRYVIKTPDDAANYAMPRLRYEKREHFAILLLDTKNQVITFSRYIHRFAQRLHRPSARGFPLRHRALRFQHHPRAQPSQWRPCSQHGRYQCYFPPYKIR